MEFPPEEFQTALEATSTEMIASDLRSALLRVNQLAAATRSHRYLTLALSEAAAGITSLRDRRDTLRQIVSTTRRITGADMAYISLNDPNGNETRIIETEGVGTQEYRNIRMPLDTGVLGRVAKANGPIQVADYLNDPDLEHLPDVDAAVAKEGVRAIMGSPLRVNGNIIGALMVAERHAHRFTTSQVLAVEALANQAAVALDNLRLLEELTSSFRRLETVQEQNRSYIHRLEKLAHADDQLFTNMTSKEGLPGLAHCLEQLLGCKTDVFNANTRLILPHRPPEDSDAVRRLLVESSTTGAPTFGILNASEHVTVMASMVENQLLGGIAVHGSLTEDQQSILKRATLVVGTVISYADVSRLDRERQRSELLTSLLYPPKGGLTTATIKDAEQHGLRNGFPFRLAAIHGTAEALKGLEDQLEARLGDQYLRSVIHDHLCLVVPETVHQWVVEHFTTFSESANNALLMAHSEPISLLESLPDELTLTDRVLHAALSLKVPDKVVSWASLGAIGIFLANTNEETIHAALGKSVRPLIQYDSTHHTALRDSALAFLDSGQNVTDTAKRLIVHPNTVRQRLERIDVLLGPDWRQGRRALDMHVLLVISKTIVGQS